MYMSVAGVPIDEFKGKGKEFADAFKGTLGGKPIDPYAIYGAQAATILLDAIARLRRLALGHHRQAVRHQGHRRPDRQLRDQRERRSRAGRRGGRRLHDLQGDDEARDGRRSLRSPRTSRRAAAGRPGRLRKGEEGQPSSFL